MTGEFVPIPLHVPDDPDAAPDIEVRTRIESHGTGSPLKKGVATQHVLQLQNKHPRNRLFDVQSRVTGDRIRFGDDKQEWGTHEVISGRLKQAKVVSRSEPLFHPGDCAPKNGHSIIIQVTVAPLFEGERQDPAVTTVEPFAYQFECVC